MSCFDEWMPPDLQICVAGWYGWQSCYEPLSKLNNVYVVAHQPVETWGIPNIVIANEGLELGCYEYYRKHIWNKTSPVVFCQDDIVINDISILWDLAEYRDPVVMVWHDEEHYRKNLAHGRMFMCSAAFLNLNPFWYDVSNKGDTSPAKNYCNEGILRFHLKTQTITKHHLTNKVRMAKRGVL